MYYKKYYLLIALLSYLLCLTCKAESPGIKAESNHHVSHPMYIGITYGYGATTWSYLISPDPNEAMTLATPIKVHENGQLWGFFAGYEICPTFAVEAAYEHYPKARIFFDTLSLFSFDHDDKTMFDTNTESASLMGKLMLIISHSPSMRVYSSVGIAGIHRKDLIKNSWTVRPKFGAGLDWVVTDHVMLDWGGDFTVGDAVSELNPSNNFIPFLYSFYMRAAYRFW